MLTYFCNINCMIIRVAVFNCSLFIFNAAKCSVVGMYHSLFYPFYRWWTLELFSVYDEHSCTFLLVHRQKKFFEMDTHKSNYCFIKYMQICWAMSKCFLKQQMYQVTFLSVSSVLEIFPFYTSSSTLNIFRVLNFCQSGDCEMVSYYLNLHFLYYLAHPVAQG